MNVPNHIAIILDGNGRWAKAKGMPRSYGHVKGCANLETVCDYMKELGVKYVTVYAFSTENWKRSKDEVDGLMKLFRSYLKKCIKLADKNKMRVRVIGEVSAFDQDIQESIARLEQYSQKYDEIYFQIALNYGSRDEIIRGIRKLAQDAADGKVKPEEIDEHVFDSFVFTKSFVFQISLTDIFLMSQLYQLPPTEGLSLYVRNGRKLLFHGRSVFLSQAS